MSSSASARRIHRRLMRSSLAAALLALAVPVLVAPGSTASAASAVNRYVALGDSYAAGIGIPNDKGAPAGCDRSDHNYATLTGQALAVPQVVDVTCGGATTVEMTQPQTVSGGTNPPQLDALTADTDLVTLQIGGNDIGFGNILQSCIGASLTNPFGSPCRDQYTAGGTDQLAQRIAATAPKIAAAVQAIRERAPHAKVLVLGYPAILPDAGWGCWPSVPIAFGDTPYLRDKQKALNSMIAQNAKAQGATYVDVYKPSIGHDACQGNGRWVEGLNQQTPFHPNATGHQGMAAAIKSSLS
ncbi:SGNH/GDSL hydrolase family protein [Yinghuangia aomiensis]|uniref:SGNH/GDSL hydrolase family protein n=1 Tax=Yinghuangia aomiensis TaxID=676205 RepID=A0ABP9I0E8_9ACTN